MMHRRVPMNEYERDIFKELKSIKNTFRSFEGQIKDVNYISITKKLIQLRLSTHIRIKWGIMQD